MGKAAKKANRLKVVKPKGNGQVVVLYPTPGMVCTEFHECLMSAIEYDWASRKKILSGRVRTKGSNVAKMRNSLIRDYLDSTDSEWSIFIDTDMTFDRDAIHRLVEAAGDDKDIIGGLCFFRNSDSGQLMPTIYDDDPKSITKIRQGYARDEVQEAAATGTAFLLVRRKVYETLQAKTPEARFPWFQDTVTDSFWYGEDITFCLRARAAGFRVWVDSSIKIGHIKDFELAEDVFINQQIQQARMATNVVIIPVKDRLDLTEPLVEELVRQNEAHEIVLLDNGSNKETKDWLLSQKHASVFDCKGLNIHQMWNLGADYANNKYRVTNLHFLNNDIEIGDHFISGLAAGLRADLRLLTVCPNYDGRTSDNPIEVIHGICANRYDGTGGLSGFAFTVRGEFFHGKNGYKFPEELNWWYGDNDFVMTVEHEFRSLMGMVIDTTCKHIGGGSQTERPAKWDELIEADRIWYNDKWGIKQNPEPAIRYVAFDDVKESVSGGARKLFDHVELLKQKGINAEIVYVSELPLTIWHPDDLAIIPELFGDAIQDVVPPGIRRISFVQNAYLVNRHVKDLSKHPFLTTPDLVGVIVESQHTEDIIRRDFPNLKVPIIRTHTSGNGLLGKDAGFSYGDWPRKREVLYFQYKHAEANREIFNNLDLPGGWTVKCLSGLTDAEIQDAMRTSAIFAAANVNEGMCAPTVEAIISGCINVCWPGGPTGQTEIGGPMEYLAGRAIIAKQDDIEDLRNKIVETARDVDDRIDYWGAETRRFSEWFQITYSRDAEIAELYSIADSFGFK